MIMQTFEMRIIGNYIVSSTYNCAIHKFIVVFIRFYQIKTEIRIFTDYIFRTC